VVANGAARRGSVYGIAALLVASTALAMFLNIRLNHGLSDDHFGYLAMAQQIRFGEVPIRDFVDLGTFLHLWMSAAVAQAGDFFLSELLMSWAFIVAGQAVAMYLVWRGTGSLVAAALAGIVTMLMFPRPYSFPKVFVYPVTVWLLWNYVDEPRRAGLWGLGLWAAAALLLRFDHGVAVLVSALGTVLLAHGTQSLGRAGRSVGELTAAFVVGLLPFLVFLSMNVGVLTHIETMLAFFRYGLDEAERIRWQPFLGDPWLTGRRGTAFLYDVIALLTVAATLWAGARLMRDFTSLRRFSTPTLRLCAVVGLWLTSAPMLVRNNFEARIPDASSLLVIMAGLVAVPWRTLGTAPPRRLRVAYGAGGIAIAGFAILAVVRGGGTHFTLDSIQEVFSLELARGNIASLTVSPPIDGYAAADIRGEGGLERYLHECTRPDDRVLVPFFHPQLYVYAERGFAGGQWRYFRFHNSSEEQSATLQKLATEHVPVAILRRSEWESFRAEWELLANHIESRYRRVDTYRPEGDDIEVWVDRSRSPTGTAGGDVPCFR
jgi:hypothetical protein